MKEEDVKEIEQLTIRLKQYAQMPAMVAAPVNNLVPGSLRNELSIAEAIAEEYPSQWEYIKAANKTLVVLNTATRQLWINQLSLGQIIAILDTVISEERKPGGWQCVHPLIQKSSKQLYLDGHYANAAEDAFIELNDRGKEIYKKLKPGEPDTPDGRDLMNKLFGQNGLAKLADTNTETGKGIQEGFHLMFAGSMAGLRNPKAHSNTVKITTAEAMRRLMFASILMYKLDEVDEKLKRTEQGL